MNFKVCWDLLYFIIVKIKYIQYIKIYIENNQQELLKEKHDSSEIEGEINFIFDYYLKSDKKIKR